MIKEKFISYSKINTKIVIYCYSLPHSLIVYYLLTLFISRCPCLSLLFSVKPEDVQLTTNASANKACPNDVVSFDCSAANANPPAMYHFFENDVLFGSSSSGMLSKMVMNSGNLTYKCVANNTAGTTSSQNVSITVNGKSNHDHENIGCVLFSFPFVCIKLFVSLSVPFLLQCACIIILPDIF